MHAEAYEWVARYRDDRPLAVLDIGGRDVNGSTRSLFPNAAAYTVVDALPGAGVDHVTDAADWTPDRAYDVVLCTETFEHTPRWREILRTAHAALLPGGLFVATMAGPGRPEHSAIDGGLALYPGEHYANVEPVELSGALQESGFTDVVVDYRWQIVEHRWQSADTRCVARRGPL